LRNWRSSTTAIFIKVQRSDAASRAENSGKVEIAGKTTHCARINGDVREFVDSVERFSLGKIMQLSKGWTH
jgi:hypothetical protein